jgi:hypothetical protein
MHILYRISADFIWVFHLGVIILVLFGWLVPSLWWIYLFTLVITLLSEIALNYCFLSKWEFDLRKKINPDLHYDYSYTSYYTYKLTGQHLSTRFLARTGIFFTTFSLAINLYFAFWF